jgi:transcriptional regulator with XRE-family HTH domain
MRSCIFFYLQAKYVLCDMMSERQKTMQNSFCKKLKDLRNERKWSQEYLAYRLGVSAPSISKIESGITNVTLSSIKQIAVIFELPMVELLRTERDGPNNVLNDASQLVNLKERLCMRETEITILQRKVIELYEELQVNTTLR